MLRPIIGLMVAPKRGTNDIENAYIDKAVFAAWEKKGTQASIDDVAEYLNSLTDERAKDMSTMIFPYTSQGAYGRFFNGEGTINFKSQLVVIELGELKDRKELQSVVVQTVVMQIMNQMLKGDRKTPVSIIMDEVWDILSGKQKEGAEFAEAGVRQARKFRGSLVFGTQSVHDFYASPAAQAAFENSDWLCLLSQKKESIAQLKKSEKLLLDPAAEELLTSVTTQQGKFAEIMIVGPHGSAVGRLITDPFTRILYSTKAEEYAAVKQYQSQGMSLVEAVEQVAKSHT
jgi:conjugal transfer ATP-binding protein TraC